MMKPAVFLLGLALLPLPAHADKSQASPSSAPILVTPSNVILTNGGCDITLPPGDTKTVVDRMYLVIDGKSEDLIGWYNPDARRQTKSIHYLASASSDMDSQVKSILTAQGLSTKPDVTTYHIAAGIGIPGSSGGYSPAVETLSKTLHFAHTGDGSVNVLAFNNKVFYKIGDKIPILDEVVLDSDTTIQNALGPNNTISTGKFAALPAGQMHRITIQVQFVPKPKEEGAASQKAGSKKGQG